MHTIIPCFCFFTPEDVNYVHEIYSELEYYYFLHYSRLLTIVKGLFKYSYFDDNAVKHKLFILFYAHCFLVDISFFFYS